MGDTKCEQKSVRPLSEGAQIGYLAAQQLAASKKDLVVAWRNDPRQPWRNIRFVDQDIELQKELITVGASKQAASLYNDIQASQLQWHKMHAGHMPKNAQFFSIIGFTGSQFDLVKTPRCGGFTIKVGNGSQCISGICTTHQGTSPTLWRLPDIGNDVLLLALGDCGCECGDGMSLANYKRKNAHNEGTKCCHKCAVLAAHPSPVEQVFERVALPKVPAE